MGSHICLQPGHKSGQNRCVFACTHVFAGVRMRISTHLWDKPSAKRSSSCPDGEQLKQCWSKAGTRHTAPIIKTSPYSLSFQRRRVDCKFLSSNKLTSITLISKPQPLSNPSLQVTPQLDCDLTLWGLPAATSSRVLNWPIRLTFNHQHEQKVAFHKCQLSSLCKCNQHI